MRGESPAGQLPLERDREDGRVLVGAGLKMYLGHRQTLDWMARVAEVAQAHPGLRSGSVELVVLPTFPTL